MTDWYVDANQSGGNGTHPSSSYPSVLSITWAAGDRAWLRRTHYETLPDSATPGPNFAVDAFSRWGFVIGWPDSGDPFFDERPTAGITSGWDVDVPSTSVYSVYGLKFPTLNNSNNAAASGLNLPRGCYMANIAFQNSGGGTLLAWRARTDFQSVIVDNALILSAGGPTNRLTQVMENRFGKIFLVLSGAGALNNFWASGTYIDHCVLHGLSVYSGGLLRGIAFDLRIGHLEFLTASIDYLGTSMTSAIAIDAHLINMSIGRCSGSQPYSGDMLESGLGGNPLLAIDDYFGLGPRILNADKPSTVMCGLTQAMHNGQRVMKYDVVSVAAANQNYQANIWRLPAMRKMFDVVSGTLAKFRIPIYVDSTFVFSPAAGMLKANLLARGAKPSYAVLSTVLPGSPTLWSGDFVVAGSAWLWEVKFNPTETGLVPLEIYAPPLTQTTSGQGLRAYALFSEPYSA